MDLNILILSLLPAIIYILIIYVTVPYKKIGLKISLKYLFIGFLSVGVLKYIWFIFPVTTELAETISDPYLDPFMFFHYFYFAQVGFLEEISKLIIFLIIGLYRRKTSKVNDNPIATMFYMGMVSLGFSVVENIQYGIMYGDEVLYFRAITAVIAHMVFGLFMGYWIAIGKMGARFYDRSLLDIIVNKRKRLRNVLYTIIGLISASILHGVYDLHLEFNGQQGITGIYMLLIFSVLGAYWCFKHLIHLYNIKQKHLKK